MSSFAAITDYLLNQSVHIAVLFIVLAAVCFAIRKKTAHVRYLLWLIIIAKCLVPSLMTVSLAILPSAPEAVAPIVIESPLQMDTGFTAPRNVVYTEPVSEPTFFERLMQIPPKVWFVYLWVAGALIYGLVVIAKAVRLNRYLVAKRKAIPEGLANEFDGFIEKLPACYMVKGIAQPFVWGLVKGSIYLPANFIRSTTPEHRRQIVSHEAGHVNRFDPLVNLFQIIAQTVFFFHPLVWIANRMIREEREKCCDEIAIAGLNATPRDYGSAIVETLVKEYESTMPIPSMAIAGPIKNIEDRIKTIMNPDKKFYKRPTVIALIAVLLVAAFAIPTSFALTEKETGSIIAQTENFIVLDMDIRPIQQGKNEIYVTVRNETNTDRVFAIHLYTRSVDYGDGGVGWGTNFFDTIDASSTKECRFIYKIQGPVTENTWLKVKLYDPPSEAEYDHEENVFYEKRYSSSDLPHLETAKLAEASKAQYRQASQMLRRMKSYIKDKDYESVWDIFTDDFQRAEYQRRGLESFKKSMEPTNPVMAAFHWDKGQFLKLKPKSASVRDGKIVLTAFYEGQPWSIEMVKVGRELKIDWIGGYRPAILDMQEADTKRDAEIKKELQGLVEDFFKNNYRDVTAKKTLLWGEPEYHDNGNVSIRHMYEATIWDKDTMVINDEFTFDKDGGFVSVKKIRRGPVGSTEWIQELVEHFFNNNYRDITARETIEWGEAFDNRDGSFSIRYKYEATIWDKDKLIQNKVFTFDRDEKYISAKDIGTPEKAKKFRVRLESAGKLKKLGTMVFLYANDYNDKYPKSLKDVNQYDSDNILEWVEQNVKYIAKEGDFTGPHDAVVAYDHTLLKKGNGTNVLFNDGHVEFCKPDHLKKLGIVTSKESSNQANNKSQSSIIDKYRAALEQRVTVDIYLSKLSVQYAVIAICETAGVPYQWDKSAELAEPQRRKFIDPLHIDEKRASKALDDILKPVGLHYELDNNGLYLSNQKQVNIEVRFMLASQEFLDDIKDGIEEMDIELPKNPQDTEIINDLKVSYLIRATQAHKDGKILTSPRFAVLDGEQAVMRVQKEQIYVTSYQDNDGAEPTAQTETVETGIVANALPVIAEDGENIMLEFDAELKEVLEVHKEFYKESVYKDKYPYEVPMLELTSVKTRVLVPDGGTLMLGGNEVTAKSHDGTTDKQVLLVLVKSSIVKPKAAIANK